MKRSKRRSRKMNVFSDIVKNESLQPPLSDMAGAPAGPDKLVRRRSC